VELTDTDVDKSYPILPVSRVGDLEASRAVLSSGSEFNGSIFRVDETSPNTYPGGYTGIEALPIAVAADGKVTITPDQYYLPNGYKTALLGVYPAATVAGGSGIGTWLDSGPTVTYTIDGKTDIMASAFVAGDKTSSPQPQLEFKHLLTQIVVYVYASSQKALDSWGDVNSIQVVGREKTCIVTLPTPGATGTVTTGFSTGNTGDLFLYEIDGDDASLATANIPYTGEKTSAVLFGYCMFPPVTTTDDLTLRVKTVNSHADGETTTLEDKTFAAGSAYKITLKLDLNKIEATATIAPWTDGNTLGDIDTSLN
jgi:hypothetical protein